MEERLQKIISAAGVTSRRAAETLILEGRVRVNGKVVTELGSKADASRDHIKVDGKLINPKQPPTYLMLNKPTGFVTTMSDPEGRPTVQDLLKGVKTRVYPVGRLDYNTEGLLLLTNDGDFAHLITHPRHEFPKTYLAKIKGVLDDRMVEQLEQGMFLADGKTAPARVRKIRKEEANSWVEITIYEGRTRQVRRMFDHVGRSVIRLKRNRIGGLPLGDLPEGEYRHLTPDEVRALKETALETGQGGRPVRSFIPDAKKLKEPAPQAAAPSSRSAAPRSFDMPATREPKKVHKGKPDMRPWRREERRGEAPDYREAGGRYEARGRGFKPGRPSDDERRGARRSGFSTGGERRNESSARPASGRGSSGKSVHSYAGGAFPRKAGAKPNRAQGAGQGRSAGAAGGGASGRGTRGAERMNTSGPRNGRSSHPGRKAPGRGAKFSGRGPERRR